jgi:hypothetical protein
MQNRDFYENFVFICWSGRSTYKYPTTRIKNQNCSVVLELKDWEFILPISEHGTVCKL